MRRFLSILLLAVFSLPLFTPLLASGASGDLRLPACCRRDGKHHCMMSTASSSRSDKPSQHGHSLTILTEKCPYAPGLITATHSNLFSAPRGQTLTAAVIIQASGIAQTESMWRIARDRSRSKRGPPSLLG